MRSKSSQDVLSGLHDKQLAFVGDESLRKSALCGRRAGKTHVVTRMLVDTCLKHPDTFSVYIALTRQSAKDLVWRPLLRLNREYNLKIKFNSTELTATFENGAYVKLVGLDKEPEIEKLRGPKYKMVVLDEGASFPEWVQILIEEVLEPALEDERGTLLAVGTPGNICAGYFYDITEEADKNGFSCHRWNVTDNSKFPQWADDPNWQEYANAWLVALKKKKGWDDTNPVYQREWMGQWIATEDDLMYHVGDKNLCEVGKGPTVTSKVLGLDLGWHDHSAFVVAGYNQVEQKCVELDTIQRKKLTVNEIMNIAEMLVDLHDPDRIVVDSAGEGQIILNSLADEITRRFNIPVSAAEKSKKASFVRLLDGDLRVGRVLLKKDGQLAKQMKRLQWNDKYTREKEGQACDLADAFLYAYRECLHWADEPAKKRVPKGPQDEGYWKHYEEEMIRKEEEAYSNSLTDADWYDVNLRGVI